MFICNECLKKSYKNEPMLFARSVGPCEVCHKTADCNDIPSWALEGK